MKEILQFLKQLSENNDRAWFQANKEYYQEINRLHATFVQAVIKGLSPIDPEIAKLEVKDTVFRIYRDTRFSADKTPYKTHIGAYLAKGGRKSPRAGYYIHIEPGGSLLAGGIWCPDAPLLKALREDVYNHADEFRALINDPALASAYHLSDDDKLKKIPTPYPKDSPDSELVKYKSYTVIGNVPDTFFEGTDAVQRCIERLSLLTPLNRFLNETVDESAE